MLHFCCAWIIAFVLPRWRHLPLAPAPTCFRGGLSWGIIIIRGWGKGMGVSPDELSCHVSLLKSWKWCYRIATVFFGSNWTALWSDMQPFFLSAPSKWQLPLQILSSFPMEHLCKRSNYSIWSRLLPDQPWNETLYERSMCVMDAFWDGRMQVYDKSQIRLPKNGPLLYCCLYHLNNWYQNPYPHHIMWPVKQDFAAHWPSIQNSRKSLL